MNPPHTPKDDPPDFQGTEPFSPAERAHLRRLLDEDAKATWLRGRIKVVWPWAVAVMAALVAVFDWVQKHIKFS